MEASLELRRLVKYVDEQGDIRYELALGGTFDDAPGPDQMRAVHHALVTYFDSEDWLAARRQEMPGM